MAFPIYIIDSFIAKYEDSQFDGNPAAVCLLQFDDDITDDVKQWIAKEMNQSVTAFVSTGWEQGRNVHGSDHCEKHSAPTELHRTIRWFTPLQEIFSCGHATLASVKVLQMALNDNSNENVETIQLHTKKIGIVPAFHSSTELSFLFPMNLPKPINREECPWLYHLIGEVLGPDLQTVSTIADIEYSSTAKILMIRLDDRLGEAGLRSISPNFEKMLQVDTNDQVLAVAVTALGNGGKNHGPDFYCRYFAPWIGINEDQATGSIHTVLVPYWRHQLNLFSRTLRSWQCSSRGGEIVGVVKGDKVSLSGQARLVLGGHLHIPSDTLFKK